MRLKLLNVLIFVILLHMVLWVGCANRPTVLSCMDVVSLTDNHVLLRAKLERSELILKDIESEPIEFSLLSAPAETDVKIIKQKITDEDGWAIILLNVSKAGLYRVQASYRGNSHYQPSQDEFCILAVAPQYPVIILDVDGTLTKQSWAPWEHHIVPYDKDTVKVLTELSDQYAIVYLTGRPRPLHRQTQNWLSDNGFPPGPVIVWSISKTRWLRPKNYKTDVIAELRRSGINLAVGIGNTNDDMDAYQESGLLSIILGEKGKKSTVIQANSWSEISSILKRTTNQRR